MVDPRTTTQEAIAEFLEPGAAAMIERLTRTLLLLRSRDLYDPCLPTTTGRLIDHNTMAEAGEGNEEWVDCPDCGGEGERRIRGVLQRCGDCKGRGLRLVDQYTGREIGSEKTEVKTGAPLRMVPCDACRPLGWREERSSGVVMGERCPYCRGSGWAPAFQQPIRPFRESGGSLVGDLVRGLRDPVLRAIVLKGALGSYDELSVAMGALRIADFASYRATAALEHDRRSLKEIRYELSAWFGLVFLERRMPAEIRVPPDVLAIEKREAFDRRKRERRDEAA